MGLGPGEGGGVCINSHSYGSTFPPIGFLHNVIAVFSYFSQNMNDCVIRYFIICVICMSMKKI